MQVHTLSQYIRGNNDVVPHWVAFKIGIEVFFDSLSQTVAVCGCYHQYICTTNFICQSFVQIIQSIDTFREQYQFSWWINGSIKEYIGKILTELIKLWIIILFCPISIELFQYLTVMVEHFKKIGTECISREEYILSCISFCNGILDDFIKFHILCLQVFNLQVGSDDNFVLIEHLNHICCDTKKCTEWLLESIETALQTFYHMYTIDGSQCLTDVYSVLILATIFRFQELNGTITGISQSFALWILISFSIGQLL